MVIYASRQYVLQNSPGDVEKVTDLINVLVFEDYTTEELMRILKRKLEDEHLVMNPSARQHMQEFTSRLTANPGTFAKQCPPDENCCELIIRTVCNSLAKNGKLKNKTGNKISVVKSDVNMFTEDLIRVLMNEKKKIGFK